MGFNSASKGLSPNDRVVVRPDMHPWRRSRSQKIRNQSSKLKMSLFSFTISDVNYFIWSIYIFENGLKIWLIGVCIYEQLYWLSDGIRMRNICNVSFTAEWSNWVPKTNCNFPTLFTLRGLSLAHKQEICKDMTMSGKLIRHVHSAALSRSLQ